MQTAVDPNGSSNTKTTTSTINSATRNDNDEYPTGTMTQNHQYLSQAQQNHLSNHHTYFLMQPTPETETTTILRNRVNVNTNNSTDYSAIAKNGLYDYVDRNSECIPAEPSISPKALPPKSSKLKGDFLELALAKCVSMHAHDVCTSLQETYNTNTSPESSSSDIVNSIVTTLPLTTKPVIQREDNNLKSEEEEGQLKDNARNEDSGVNLEEAIQTKNVLKEIGGTNAVNKSEEVAKDCKKLSECVYKQLLTNQRLPNENTFSAKELSSTPLLMSSSTTSFSIATSSVPNINRPSSLLLSSSFESTISLTPASTSTTPAFLSALSSSPSSSVSSSTSSSASLLPITSSVGSKKEKLQISGLVEYELLQWQDMPQYLQFNPYVLKGYRPLTTFKGCLLSLFYWHNETINIITHAIPIVCILAIVPGLMPWENGYRFLSFCHVFGAVAPWCGSFIYHLFMNIEQGEYVYNRLLKLDMLGIWVSQSFGALPLLTASTFCFTFKWKWFIIISYCLLSFWGLYKALTASSPWQRRLSFGLPFAMRSVLTFFRTMGLVGGNRVALEHVYLQDGVSILGGVIGAMRIPEKWFPGLVDFYLNSHNIMHVLVVVAVYSMYKATMKDFEWMESANCDAFVNITSKVFGFSLNTKIEL